MSPSKKRNSAHPLLLPPEEAIHQLSDEGADRVEDDADLAPGHDCCAVCAAVVEPALTCSLCDSVQYCCAQHLLDDAPNHSAVCKLMKIMRSAETRQIAQQQQQPGTISPFRTPCGGQDGWMHVVPEQFSVVLPVDNRSARDDTGADEPLKKRVRLTPEADPSAKAQQGIEPSAAAPKCDEAAPSSAPQSPPDSDLASATDSEAQLDLAADLADRTAVLTYAYTAAMALQKALWGSTTGSNGAAAELRQRPLRVVVLGAAADAELADLESWQVVSNSQRRDVHLCFVGPEVPDELAGKQKRLGRTEMTFKQCTFDELLDSAAAGKAAPGDEAVAESGPPDVYLAFNPGFTCPDYEWADTLQALARTLARPAKTDEPSVGGGRSAGAQFQLIVATNTRSEADMDAEMLRAMGWLAAGQPAPNPYTSLKVLQNGTLANDLYRKNAWLTYYCRASDAKGRGGRRRWAGGKAKAAVGTAAQALYDTMVAPLTRLFQKR